MPMERKQFLERISTVAPALASNDLIPALTHFWFTGNQVMAFNDQIAISVPCKVEFTGAVPGTTLLELMKSSKARDVELVLQNDNLLVKAASARVKLATLPPTSFIFEMPAHKTQDVLPVNVPDFLAAIENCMRSVSHDTSVPDQLGITLIPEDRSILRMYSTNGDTLSYADVKLSKEVSFDRVILSAPFCEQMLTLGKNTKSLQLEIHEDYALLTCGATQLFGRLIETTQPLPFDKTLSTHFSDKDAQRLGPIPSKLRLILERAVIIADAKTDRTQTEVTVAAGADGLRMRFVSRSDRGEVIDTMQVTDKQPEVSVKLDARLLKQGYGFFDQMLITKNCAVMAKGTHLYLVSAFNN